MDEINEWYLNVGYVCGLLAMACTIIITLLIIILGGNF